MQLSDVEHKMNMYEIIKEIYHKNEWATRDDHDLPDRSEKEKN